MLDSRLTNGGSEDDNAKNNKGSENDLQNGQHNEDDQGNEHLNGENLGGEGLNGENMNGLNTSNSTSDDDGTNIKLPKAVIDLEAVRSESGCKDLRNIRKFSKAAEMMGWEINAGKRKGNIYFLVTIITPGQSVFLSLSSQRQNRETNLCKKLFNKTTKIVNLNLNHINPCCFVICF